MINLLFILIVIQSLISLILIKGIYSRIYFTFSLIFFGIFPYNEYLNEVFYWGFPAIDDSTYAITNLILIFSNIIFSIFYLVNFNKRVSSANIIYRAPKKGVPKNIFYRLLFISLATCVVVLFVNNFQIANLLFRSGLSSGTDLDNIELLLFNNLRLVPFICFLIYFSSVNKFNAKGFFLILLILITSFPTSIPRFQSAAIYLTIVACFYPSILNGLKIPFVLIASLFTFFPVFDKFRNYSTTLTIDVMDLSYIFAGHFDSYQSLAYVIQYNIITFGWQLLGPLLFFVPRVVWTEKPIGSGHYMANLFNLDFTNISSNIYAEGYINFGLFGIFLFAALLGYLCGYLSRQLKNDKLHPRKKFLIYYTCFYLFYILRGDLMSSFAYLIGFIATFYLINFLVSLQIFSHNLTTELHQKK